MRYIFISVFLFFFSFQLANSENQGINSWTLNYSNSGRVYGMVIDPNNQNIMYHVGLDSGVYKTVNAGLSWLPVNNGITYKGVFCIAIAPSNSNVLYAGTDQNGATSSGVYVSTDAGVTWTLRNSGIVETSLGIQQIVVHPTNPAIAYMTVFDGLVASTNGVYKTSNYGVSWLASSTGMTNKNILSLLINPKNPNVIYAGSSLILPGSTGPSKMFKSYDAGVTWNDISNGLPTNAATGDPIRALSMSTVDTSRVLAALFMNDTAGGAYLTTNGGQLWVKKSTGLPTVTGTLLRACSIRPGTTNQFFLGMDGGTTTKGVWRSTDGGNSWADFNSGLMVNTYPVRALAFKTVGDTTLYAGGANTTMPGRGIFEYSWPAPIPVPSGTWTEQTSPVLTELNSVSAVDDNVAWASGAAGKVVRTTNKGVLWSNVSGDLPITNAAYVIWGFDASNAVLTTSPSAGAGTRIFKTTNGGTNWVQTFFQSDGWGDGFYFINATTGFFYGDHVGTRLSVFKTTNGGTTWDSTGLNIQTTSDGWNNAMFGLGNQIWIGTNGTSLFYSSNAGVNWTSQTTPAANQYGIWFNSPTKGLAGGGALYRTTNSGTNWATLTSPIANNLTGVCGAETSWWFTAFTALVYTSSNDGTTWSTAYTAPAGTFRHLTKARNGSTIWGVRTNGGISRYGTPIVGVTPVSENIPVDYQLSQNYPNPFNPVTKISFGIPKQGLVTLKVYDIMGREITTLVNEVKSAGSYSIDFDASAFSSGTYFYKLSSGSFIATKKMILLK